MKSEIMNLLALLFTIAGFGIAETSYLIRERRAARAPVCPVGVGCHAVLTSRFNRLLGIHNDIVGFLFYVASAILTGLLITETGPSLAWKQILAALITGSAGFSLVFLFLQWRVLKTWCFWCVMSALTVFAMAAIALFL